MTGIADVHAYLSTKAEGNAELATDILDVIGIQELSQAERLIQIRQMCEKAIEKFEKYN